MDDCYHCGFYDCELGACTCPHSDRWYAGACATATEDNFIDVKEEKQMNQARMCERCKKYVFDYQIVEGRTYRKKARRYYCSECMSKILTYGKERLEWEAKNNSTK